MSKKRYTKSRRTRRRIGVALAKREHAETMSGRYYLTLVKRDRRCSACGRTLRSGKAGSTRDEMVYNRGGGNGALSGRSPVMLCVPCADTDPLIDYRTSEAWERIASGA